MSNRWVVAALGVGVVAGSWFSRSPLSSVYDGKLEVSPVQAKPGDVVEVKLPGDDGDGGLYSMHKEGRRKMIYLLFGSRDSKQPPTWSRAEDVREGSSFATVSFTNSQPYRVLIPPPTPNGTYSICYNDMDASHCGRLKVSR
jgi:hypothetical protein